MVRPALLLLAPLLMASAIGGSGGAIAPTPGYVQLATSSALGLYVNPSSGSDTSSCVASTAPCASVAGACAKIPHQVRHAVTITMQAGTYSGGGCNLAGYSIEEGGSITVTGVDQNFTPATGTASGTATGAVAGSGLTLGTLTDSGQLWTVNNLRGYRLWISGGTGSGQVYVIASNTATAVTIQGIWATAPAAGSTYAILDHASLVAGNYLAFTNVQSSTTSQSTAFAVGGLSGVYQNHSVIRFRKLKFTSSTSRGISIWSGGVDIQECSFATSSIPVQVVGEASLWVQHNTFNVPATTPLSLLKGGFVRQAWVQNNLIISGNYSPMGFSGRSNYVLAKYNQGLTIAVAGIRLSSFDDANIQFDKYNAPSSQCVRVAFTDALNGIGAMAIDGITCDNPGAQFFSVAGNIDIRLDLASGVGSTGSNSNGVAIFTVNGGAKIQISSTTNFTESANGININDTTNGRVLSIATLRAMDPKRVCTDAKTCIWQSSSPSPPGFLGPGVQLVPTATASLPAAASDTDGLLLYDSTRAQLVRNTSSVAIPIFDAALSNTFSIPTSALIAGAYGTTSVTVTGAVAGAGCLVAMPTTIEAGLTWRCVVTATNTVVVQLNNPTTGLITPAASQTGKVVVVNL